MNNETGWNPHFPFNVTTTKVRIYVRKLIVGMQTSTFIKTDKQNFVLLAYGILSRLDSCNSLTQKRYAISKHEKRLSNRKELSWEDN